jgi:hypothetical protein
MALSAKDFRNIILRPILDEYDQGYDLLHRAYSAVAAVDAYAAHIFFEARGTSIDPFEELGLDQSGGNDDLAFRQAIAKQNPDFRVLRDLAKANKHALLTRHKPTIVDSGRTSAKWKGWGEGKFSEGRNGGVMQIFVTDEDGCEHYVETLVKNSMKELDEMAVKLRSITLDE